MCVVCVKWAQNQERAISWATQLKTKFRGHLVDPQRPTFCAFQASDSPNETPRGSSCTVAHCVHTAHTEAEMGRVRFPKLQSNLWCDLLTVQWPKKPPCGILRHVVWRLLCTGPNAFCTIRSLIEPLVDGGIQKITLRVHCTHGIPLDPLTNGEPVGPEGSPARAWWGPKVGPPGSSGRKKSLFPRLFLDQWNAQTRIFSPF